MHKIIFGGDLHGTDLWKYLIYRDYDVCILAGDYFDSKDKSLNVRQQIGNFERLVEFKERHPEKRLHLLLGNHDVHYHDQFLAMGERYSGFQKEGAKKINRVLMKYLKHFEMCHQDGKYVFSHAGVTRTWLYNNLIPPDEHMAHNINALWKHRPLAFRFQGHDFAGDDVTQSPVWVRPYSLNKDRAPGIHVVGHTKVKRIFPEGPVILADALRGDAKEFVRIKNNVITVDKLYTKCDT